MSLVRYTCPFCKAAHITSTVAAHFVVPKEGLGSGEPPYADVATRCESCFSAVCVRVTSDDFQDRLYHHNFQSAFMQAVKGDAAPNSMGFTCRVLRTPSTTSALPEHLSPAVQKALTAAETNFDLPHCEDASATMFRRAIDVAIREKHPKVTGMLKPRIDKLNKEGFIPDAMKAWTDEIRLIGNDGAHEPEGVDRSELAVLRAFTDAFLRYYISLPFEVELRRGKINDDGSPEVAEAAKGVAVQE